jgi:hypothetical protein
VLHTHMARLSAAISSRSGRQNRSGRAVGTESWGAGPDRFSCLPPPPPKDFHLSPDCTLYAEGRREAGETFLEGTGKTKA